MSRARPPSRTPPTPPPAGDDDPTRVYDKLAPSALSTPTVVDARPLPPPPSVPPRAEPAPLRVISRKEPGAPGTGPMARVEHEVKLRQLADVLPAAPVLPVGHLAPPRDRRAVRARRVRDNVLTGVAALGVAAIVGLIVWFLAR